MAPGTRRAGDDTQPSSSHTWKATLGEGQGRGQGPRGPGVLGSEKGVCPTGTRCLTPVSRVRTREH